MKSRRQMFIMSLIFISLLFILTGCISTKQQKLGEKTVTTYFETVYRLKPLKVEFDERYSYEFAKGISGNVYFSKKDFAKLKKEPIIKNSQNLKKNRLELYFTGSSIDEKELADITGISAAVNFLYNQPEKMSQYLGIQSSQVSDLIFNVRLNDLNRLQKQFIEDYLTLRQKNYSQRLEWLKQLPEQQTILAFHYELSEDEKVMSMESLTQSWTERLHLSKLPEGTVIGINTQQSEHTFVLREQGLTEISHLEAKVSDLKNNLMLPEPN
ncbi:hypothetical protein P7D92_08520 [Enterococcus dongliensis]|uniref:hypothetical protein n=1 Tax=Enterococcus dongliensis TaxID=2559925 RepID=UPI0028920876|nr:hypothetical protein [Enterococcus dongliensis]MDT2645437.1 hypothetical protein [Enterococcus dongliensis]MDT2677001.1 hypothetical protein [Enterococcus dongliensis]